MGNAATQSASLTTDQRLKQNGLLVPPLFGSGCDVWSSPPTRPSTALPPYWSGHPSSNAFLLRNSIVCEHFGRLSSVLNSVLVSPLAVCTPGMALLSKEHLRVGIWHSASTPNLDGKVVTRWSTNGNNSSNSEGKSIGLRVSKLFSWTNQTHDDSTAGIDVHVNIPTNPSQSSEQPSGLAHAFYQHNLGSNEGNLVISASLEKGDTHKIKTGDIFPQDSMHQTTVGTGIHFSNKLIYAQSKPLVLSLGFTSKCNLKSDIQYNDLRLPTCSSGSAYLLCNCISDGLLAGMQVHFPRDYFDDIISIANPFRPYPSMKYFETLKSTKPLQLSYLLSLDLNRINNLFSNIPSSSSPLDSPIVLTFHNVHTDENENIPSSFETRAPAITVSQIISAERIIFNPMEDRGPQIRNTISWALQIRPQNVSDNRNLLDPSVRAAAAWQMNRNLCTKCHYDLRDGLTLGLILKRWAHPRLTTSILFSTSNGGAYERLGWFGFKGFCLQIETGPLAHHGENSKLYDARDYLYRVDAGNFENNRKAGEQNRSLHPAAPIIIEYPRTAVAT